MKEKKKFRLYYENCNNGNEFSIEINNYSEIKDALNKHPEYLLEEENWDCVHSEEIK